MLRSDSHHSLAAGMSFTEGRLVDKMALRICISSGVIDTIRNKLKSMKKTREHHYGHDEITKHYLFSYPEAIHKIHKFINSQNHKKGYLNFRGCSYHTTTCYSESILLCSSTRERRFMCSEAGMKPLGNVRCQTVMAEMMLTRGMSPGIDCCLDISLNSRDKVPRVIIPLR